MPADPLRQAIREAVAEALAAELPRLLSGLRQPTAESKQDRRVLTVPVACKRYGIGRRALLDLVNNGRLPATTRRQRGGRDGYVLRVADCERVLAGGA